MTKYRLDIEGPGFHKTEFFEAETPTDAAMIGKDIFFTVCNYGVSEVDKAQGEESEQA